MIKPISYSEARIAEMRALGGDNEAFDRWQLAIAEHFRLHRLWDAGEATDLEKWRADSALFAAYEAWFASIPAAKDAEPVPCGNMRDLDRIMRW